LRPNTIEEVYELAQALASDNNDEIRKELGDVLLHILFYSKIGDEKGKFDIADVADALNNKLIFRHPHVFGETKVGDAHDVEQNWEQIKLKEKGGNKTVLAGVPMALPALIKAFRVQEKAANVGFDWEKPEQVWDKVREETAEVEAEIANQDHDKIEAEFGDLFFALVNAARLYKVNPENALERTNRKFIARFNHVEKRATEQGLKLKDMTLAQMDEFWNEAKSLGL
jgi:XTP/dITP diphosphohydrolase